MNIQQMHRTSLEYAHCFIFSLKTPHHCMWPLKRQGNYPRNMASSDQKVANFSWGFLLRSFIFYFLIFFQRLLQIALCILWPNQPRHHHLPHQRSQTLQSEFTAISSFFHPFKSQAISSWSLTWCCQKNTLNKSAISSHSIEFRVGPEEKCMHASANQHWFGLLRRRRVGIDAWSFTLSVSKFFADHRCLNDSKLPH